MEECANCGHSKIAHETACTHRCYDCDAESDGAEDCIGYRAIEVTAADDCDCDA